MYEDVGIFTCNLGSSLMICLCHMSILTYLTGISSGHYLGCLLDCLDYFKYLINCVRIQLD